MQLKLILAFDSCHSWIWVKSYLYKGNSLSTGNPDHLGSQERGSSLRHVTPPQRHTVSEDHPPPPQWKRQGNLCLNGTSLFLCSNNMWLDISFPVNFLSSPPSSFSFPTNTHCIHCEPLRNADSQVPHNCRVRICILTLSSNHLYAHRNLRNIGLWNFITFVLFKKHS